MHVAVLGTGIMGAPIARDPADAGHVARARNRDLGYGDEDTATAWFAARPGRPGH
jgi:3-hydroxyisobutyrate dehydrogenase-like beta-hydroxyacid dehydrogenase